ncbi:MAG: hypothetical protein A2066_00180 [Bacteroidetes bacterium GWB2_41_8]|nr:MAG: hypothetical protein A2066_00180 [Bacteroidetes bacterium GWB2_41_8]
MVRIITYDPSKPVTADFYIQNKGNHSGRPLKEPKPNCFAVYTNEVHLFELVYSLYLSRSFEPHIIGSVVPFIRLPDVKNVVAYGLERFKPERLKYLKTIREIDKALKVQQEQTKYYNELKIAIALSILKA